MWDYTPIEFFGSQKAALTAFAITLFIGNIPLIYSSQEVGEKNKIDFFFNDIIDWDKNPSTLTEYKKLLNLYSQSELAREKNKVYYHKNNTVSFKKDLNGKTFVFIANIRNVEIKYKISNEIKGLYHNLISLKSLSLEDELVLKPYEYLILER